MLGPGFPIVSSFSPAAATQSSIINGGIDRARLSGSAWAGSLSRNLLSFRGDQIASMLSFLGPIVLVGSLLVESSFLLVRKYPAKKIELIFLLLEPIGHVCASRGMVDLGEDRNLSAASSNINPGIHLGAGRLHVFAPGRDYALWHDGTHRLGEGGNLLRCYSIRDPRLCCGVPIVSRCFHWAGITQFDIGG